MRASRLDQGELRVKCISRLLGIWILTIVCGVSHATTEWSAQDCNLYTGDFDGDGKSDVLYIAKDPNMPSGIARSDGTGPNIAWQSWDSNYLGINWSGNAYNVVVADFNGDGKADIFLQSVAPGGNNYVLLTSSAGFVVAISQTIPASSLGLVWTADQHHIVAGDHRADLFLQATSPSGTDAVVLSNNGAFTAVAQSWSDGFLGFNWSIASTNVFAGDFNGDGLADLLIQAKPKFVTIKFSVPFPVPTYPANMNGVVLAQSGSTIFAASGAQSWSRMNNGIDWSPLTNNIVIANNGSGKATVILQAEHTGATSYELVGNAGGAIFPSSATALSSNVDLSADAYRLIAGNFPGGTGVGLYYQSLTSSGTDYVADSIGATITASVQNPTSVTATVEPTSVGKTAGSFAVSANGSAQYTIPISAPPGPRGMQPSLALSYDSQSGIGPLGIGWYLSGLGQITRCNLTAAQDAAPAPVSLVVSDGYCLNGSRLRLTSGTYGTSGSTYQTEIADFSNVTANGAAGNGPQYFTVQGRDGLTYQYGYTDGNNNGANSEVLANGTALTWFLSKVSDRAGNNWVVNYTPLTGTAVPSKIMWTPTSAGSSSYAYTMQFNYGTNAPQSSIQSYVAGTLVSNAQLLTSIEIFSGGTVVKDYFLGYQGSPITGRKELTSVQECADASQSNCLAPTTVAYQLGVTGLSSTSNSAVTSAGASLTTRYDLNGDGYSDLVYNSGSACYVAFGSANGYGAPVNIGVCPTLIGNLTGGIEDGLLVVVSGTWWYYIWNGSSFVGGSLGIPYDTSTYGYQLADINGDGLPDLIDLDLVYNSGTKKSTANIYVRLNQSSASVASISGTATLAYSQGGIVSAQLQTPDTQYGKLRRYDFNGDGRDDLVLMTVTGTSPNYTMQTYELLASGNTYAATTPIASIAASTFVPVYFTNWNDDKCTDFVSSNILYVSACNGTAGASYSLSGTVLQALDWDGDGRTDLLVANGSTVGVYLSKAIGVPTITATSIPYTSSCQYVWMDANGDGLDDLGCWSQSGSNAVSYYLHNGYVDLVESFMDGYGNTVSPSYIALSTGNYTEHTVDAVYPDADYIGPLKVVSQAVFSDPSAAPGVTYNQSYWYYSAWVNLQGRGFDGFSEIRMLDSRNGQYDYTYYSQAFPYTGMQYEETRTNANVNFLQTTGATGLTTLSSAPYQQRYFPYFSSWVTQQWEIGGSENEDLITTTRFDYTYDNYGNATSIKKTLTDNDPGSPYSGDSWITNISNTTDISANSSADLAAWCLTLLDQTQIVYSSTINGSSTVTRTQTYTPDTPLACRIKTIVTEPTSNSGLYKVTEALTFDAFGNVATDTVTGANMPSSPASRLTINNWGVSGQFLNSQTDPSNATTSWTYTSASSLAFGVPDSAVDANNLTTSWEYDAFGRKVFETRPDGTSSGWSWATCASFCGWSNSVYQIAKTAYQTNGTTAIRTDNAYFDSLDRVTEKSGPTVTGSTAIVQKLYNSLGLLKQQSMPFLNGSPAYQQLFVYDALNRLSAVQRPINSSNSTLQGKSYAYAGRKVTVSDPYGNTKTIVADVNGALRKTTDALGYSITKAYDAAGSLSGITDSVGNALLKNVTYAYGIMPFALAATDADRGTWAFTYDSLGERTSGTDAKGQAFAMTYDSLSRPATRTEPDPFFTQWTYGSTPGQHNVGKLISVCTNTGSSCGASPAYQESWAYETLGRPLTRTIIQSGNPGNDSGAFMFTYGYSTTTGLLNTLTYPTSTSGFALTLQYNYQFRKLQSVTDVSDTLSTCGTTCTLWTANASNGFGQVTQETLGNGVVTNRNYDAVTSWLNAVTAGVGGGAAILNQSYLQDENGNVVQRQNNNLGLTESFGYDADSRITCAALGSSCTAKNFIYDGGSAGPGNLTTQPNLATLTYPAAGQPRPHAPVAATGTFNGIANPSFTYDANGNMTARASGSQNIAWSSYNYPLSISSTDATGNEEVQFSYGPNRERWQQIYTAGGSTETTYYVGGLMDMVFSSGTTTYRHYIYAGREPVALYSRSSSGSNTMSYVLEDHLGSVSAITSNAGAVVVNESFSATGARRNPATWSGAPTTSDLNTIASLSRQGFTFQTWLGQSMGLSHMNGRVQDAVLGTMSSPDPHITHPSDAQNYNAYSYVRNNPLTYRDPTGFDDDDPGDGGDGGEAGSGGGNTSPDCSDPSQCLDPVVVQCTENCGPDQVVPPPPTLIPSGGVQLPLGYTPTASIPAETSASDSVRNMTPCPTGLVANVEYGLFNMGKNSVTTGKYAVAGGFGVGLLAAPVSYTPPGALAEGYAGVTVAAGAYTAYTGLAMQILAGSFLAYQGDSGPLYSLISSTPVANPSISLTNVSPVNPFSTALGSKAAATSGCTSK